LCLPDPILEWRYKLSDAATSTAGTNALHALLPYR
jgi:hypothetical protein